MPLTLWWSIIIQIDDKILRKHGGKTGEELKTKE